MVITEINSVVAKDYSTVAAHLNLQVCRNFMAPKEIYFIQEGTK